MEVDHLPPTQMTAIVDSYARRVTAKISPG